MRIFTYLHPYNDFILPLINILRGTSEYTLTVCRLVHLSVRNQTVQIILSSCVWHCLRWKPTQVKGPHILNLDLLRQRSCVAVH